jgi:hypothetical protein
MNEDSSVVGCGNDQRDDADFSLRALKALVRITKKRFVRNDKGEKPRLVIRSFQNAVISMRSTSHCAR